MEKINLEFSGQQNTPEIITKNIELELAGSTHNFTVQESENGQRIDSYIANQFPSYSRSFFEKLIDLELIKVNNKIISKKSIALKIGDIIEISFPKKKDQKANSQNLEALKNIIVTIVFENKHFAIINKPANLSVHPSDYARANCDFVDSTQNEITLVDWLLENIKEISNNASVGFDKRPGIVHRLDKDTTGLMIIPKNNCAHAYFADLFKERKIQKTYLAIVHEHPDKTGQIDVDIARHPREKMKMTHVNSSNIRKIRGQMRNANTSYEVLQYFKEHSLVLAKPLTGRTHQIRVHFSSIGCPLLGDALYGKSSTIITRHALHAYQLEFEFEGENFKFEQEPPKDFKDAINFFEQDKS